MSGKRLCFKLEIRDSFLREIGGAREREKKGGGGGDVMCS